MYIFGGGGRVRLISRLVSLDVPDYCTQRDRARLISRLVSLDLPDYCTQRDRARLISR